MQAPTAALDALDKRFLVILVTLAAMLAGLMLNPFLTVVNLDSAIFYLLGQGLATGKGYLLLSEPNPEPYFTFPPLLPAQIALLMKLFGTDQPATLQLIIKGSIHLMFLLTLPLFYSWLRPQTGRWGAMALTTLVAFNPLVYKYSADILSDVPFWCYTVGVLFCAARWDEAAAADRPTEGRWFWATVLMIVLAVLCRQIGLAWVLAFGLLLLRRRQWKPLIAAGLVFALAVGSWQGYEHSYRSTHQKEADALNQAGVAAVLDKSPVKLEFIKHFLVHAPVSEDESKAVNPLAAPQTLLDNAVIRLERYTNMVLDQVLPPITVKQAGKKLNVFHALPFQVLVWLLFLVGLRALPPRFTLARDFMLIYAGVLMVYPYISPRFLLPIAPLVLLCLGYGVGQASQRLRQLAEATPKPALPSPVLTRVAAGLVPACFVLTLAGGHLPQTIRWVNAGFKLKQANAAPSLRTENRGFYDALLWVKANTPPNSLVVSRKPPVTYYYSGRQSVAFPFTQKQDTLLSYLQSKASRYQKTHPSLYVVEDTAFGETINYLTPALQAHPERFKLVFTEPASGAKVWQWIQP